MCARPSFSLFSLSRSFFLSFFLSFFFSFFRNLLGFTRPRCLVDVHTALNIPAGNIGGASVKISSSSIRSNAFAAKPSEDYTR